MTGPVEILVLTFPEPQVPAAVVEGVAELVDQGTITVLDLLFVAAQDDGDVRVVEFDEDLDRFGLARLTVRGDALLSADDLETIRDGMPPGSSALVAVYEHTWARRVSDAVRAAGGELALHVRIPAADVDAAYAAATVA
ncbi:DUF6325 family protein [Pseudonocardia sichuanensis]|uniref:DUF1269 domain-containing protein n=1 Tax=Pseudonocardia kunmingensis TaxID=630975 RepID=A0A543DWD1_9PSEU|nr:DUF6325 family protein [Pseudonocardia kunmingensis]TQM13626.1 hypothetical protein FB558_0379 [Pseudonocardia kunmingensis]